MNKIHFITFIVAFIGIFSGLLFYGINESPLYILGQGVGVFILMTGGYGAFLLIQKIKHKIKVKK